MRTTETLEALENAGKHGLLNQDQVSILSEGYRHLRLIENGLRLLYDDSTNMLDFDRIDQPLILMLLKRHGYETEDLFKTVEKQPRAYAKSILKSWKELDPGRELFVMIPFQTLAGSLEIPGYPEYTDSCCSI